MLADTISYVRSRLAPHTMIDLATLTGACIVALGEYAAGLFSNNTHLQQALVRAGAPNGERLWPLPIFDEHSDEIAKGSAYADLKSTGEGRYGGSCTAAAFLKQFAEVSKPNQGMSQYFIYDVSSFRKIIALYWLIIFHLCMIHLFVTLTHDFSDSCFPVVSCLCFFLQPPRLGLTWTLPVQACSARRVACGIVAALASVCTRWSATLHRRRKVLCLQLVRCKSNFG